jgi:hypothetical protein
MVWYIVYHFKDVGLIIDDKVIIQIIGHKPDVNNHTPFLLSSTEHI